MGLKKITFTRASVLTVLLLIFCVFFFSCAHNAGVADDITLEDGTVISALTLNGEEIYAVTFINDNGKDTYVVPDVVLDGKRIRVICEKALQEYSSIRTLIIQDNITDFEMDLYCFSHRALFHDRAAVIDLTFKAIVKCRPNVLNYGICRVGILVTVH